MYTIVMMNQEYNPVVSLRIPSKMVERMDTAIATGMYRNRADYIIAALRVFDDGVNGKTGGGVATFQMEKKEPGSD